MGGGEGELSPRPLWFVLHRNLFFPPPPIQRNILYEAPCSFHNTIRNEYKFSTWLHSPDRAAWAWRTNAVPYCWMLPLATCCHTHFTSTHPTLCYSSSKIWLLSNTQQIGIKQALLLFLFTLCVIVRLTATTVLQHATIIQTPKRHFTIWCQEYIRTGVLVMLPL